MSAAIETLAWPADRLGDALTIAVRRARLARVADAVGNPAPTTVADPERIGRWLDEAAASLYVDVESLEIAYADLEPALARVAPAIVRVEIAGTPHYLVLVRSRGRRVIVVAPDLEEHAITAIDLWRVLTATINAGALPHVDHLLRVARTPRRRRARAERLLLAERLAATRLTGFWMLRPAASADFWTQLRASRAPRLFAGLLAAHTVQYALIIGSWFMVGRAMFHDQLNTAWLVAWGLLLATAIPFRVLANWAGGRLGIEVGAMLKRRLMVGALYLAPDATRHRGLGELLGRVIESDAVESLALSGAVLGFTAASELAVALLILGFGAAPAAHGLLLAAIVTTGGLLAAGYVKRLRLCTDQRFRMTNVLVERVIGHRTRLAQQREAAWHEDEDRSLAGYLHASRRADRLAVAITVLPRLWLLAGIAVLVPAFVAPATTVAALAVSVGGLVLAYRAVAKSVPLISHLAVTVIAWRELAPLLREAQGLHDGILTFEVRTSAAATDADPSRVVIEAEGLTFRYQRGAEPVLRGCTLRVHSGQRVLLEGASGGGKSTLGAVLAGIRTPDAGLLLVNGLDKGTLGLRGWRQRVVAAPQFHDNHIFSASLAFNLLMGRNWPPKRADLQEADAVCRGLGLGDLIDRMPGGMLQMVGDMGWQLSHGERSRVFMARTLLQPSQMVILDESFAALDPETVERCARCVFDRAPALLVIAHP